MAAATATGVPNRSEEHTSELQSRFDLVCRLLLEKKKTLPRPDTALFTAMNAIPSWSLDKEGGRFVSRHLESVDSGARQWTKIGSFFFNDTATTEIYTLSLHDALPI